MNQRSKFDCAFKPHQFSSKKYIRPKKKEKKNLQYTYHKSNQKCGAALDSVGHKKEQELGDGLTEGRAEGQRREIGWSKYKMLHMYENLK